MVNKHQFEPLEGCLSVEEIVSYLEGRNKDELERLRYIHDCEHDSEFGLHDHLEVKRNTKELVEIEYSEYKSAIILPGDESIHEPVWEISLLTRWDTGEKLIRAECTRIHYFVKKGIMEDDSLVGGGIMDKRIKRTYRSMLQIPYIGATVESIETMLIDTVKTLRIYKDEATYTAADNN